MEILITNSINYGNHQVSSNWPGSKEYRQCDDANRPGADNCIGEGGAETGNTFIGSTGAAGGNLWINSKVRTHACCFYWGLVQQN